MTPTQHFDLSLILQHSVANVYADLVTRRTGQAVRGRIEPMLDDAATPPVAVIDFGAVRCIDISCADEIVGKLLLQYGHVRYFILVGVDEGHREAIEPVLERHNLAVVTEDRRGALQLLGRIPERAHEVFRLLASVGAAAAAEVAERLAVPVTDAREALEELHSRHLIREEGERYQPLRGA